MSPIHALIQVGGHCLTYKTPSGVYIETGVAFYENTTTTFPVFQRFNVGLGVLSPALNQAPQWLASGPLTEATCRRRVCSGSNSVSCSEGTVARHHPAVGGWRAAGSRG